MKILAVDSSGLVASVAILDKDKIYAEYTINNKKTHSQTLLPMLDEIVQVLEIDLKEIDAIAVAGGPGSFTGLRIGSSTVKGLGMVLDKPIINVPTVDALAFNLFGTKYMICPLMDARRNQVYTGLYEFINDEFVVIKNQVAVGIDEIAAEINNMDRGVIFLGDGIDVQKETLKEIIKVPMFFAPPHLLRQRAGAVGALGLIYFEKGLVESADEHEPEYLRLSQAERERAEKSVE